LNPKEDDRMFEKVLGGEEQVCSGEPPHVHACACMCMHVRAPECICIHVHTCTYTCIHVHTCAFNMMTLLLSTCGQSVSKRHDDLRMQQLYSLTPVFSCIPSFVYAGSCMFM